MPLDLTGKPIAITGASSGIGRASALACARAGMPVAVAARRADKLREVVDEINAAGGTAFSVVCDVANPDDCRRLIDETIARFGSVYAVFANAGYGFEGPVHETDENRIREIFEVNFWGTLNTLLPAVPRMLDRGEGHLLMCSSCLSKIGVPYMAWYSATKSAQDHFGRAMRHELAPRGIHVSTVHPVGTKTELFDIVVEKSGGSRIWVVPDSRRQTAATVADAIVRCLRKPAGEVWTSFGARFGLGLFTAFPRLADFFLARQLRAGLNRVARDAVGHAGANHPPRR